MDIIKGIYTLKKTLKKFKKTSMSKAEFDNGSIFLTSSTSIEHNRIKRKY